MGRTKESEKIRRRLLELLAEKGLRQIDPGQFQTMTGQKFLETTTELYLTEVGFLHVHISSEGEGFWGYRSEILDGLTALREEGCPCFLVLLKGRLKDDAERGTDYVADGYIVEDWDWMKNSPGFSQTKKGDYRILESMLRAHGCELILSIQKVVERLTALPKRLSKWMERLRASGQKSGR